MLPSRLLGPRILRVPFVTVLVISAALGASTAWAQGQPSGRVAAPRLSKAERARRIQKRDQIRAEKFKLANAGKLDEAVTATMQELAVTRSVLGGLHEDLVDSLKFLARLQEMRGDWEAARKALTDVLTIRQRQPDQKDGEIADVRRALADLDRRVMLSPAQRQRLQEADRLNGLQHALSKLGKYAEGIEPCRKAMEIRGGLLGENHPDYALSLNNLAGLYLRLGEYAKAEPLYHQALEIWKRRWARTTPTMPTA